MFTHLNSKGHPIPRFGNGVVFDNHDKVYMFGGKCKDERLNDLWEFDLNNRKYSPVEQGEGVRPMVRNGHSMTYYDQKIIVYGGIHDVTWELDDLYIYEVKKKCWTLLESDSARKRKESGNNFLPPKVISQIEKPSRKNSEGKEDEEKKDKKKEERKKSVTSYGLSPGFSPTKQTYNNG